MSFDFVFGYMRELNDVDWAHVNQRFAELEIQGRQQLKDAGIEDGVTMTLSADMRYYGQRYEVSVSLSQQPFSEVSIKKITADFYEAYRSYYGRKIDDVPVETVSWRINVSGPRPELEVAWPGRAGGSEVVTPKGERPAIFAGLPGPVVCRVFERSELPIGAQIAGPAIIEDTESTTIIPPGSELNIDDQRMIVIDISKVSL
jgi:N-methylhydantoinase A